MSPDEKTFVASKPFCHGYQDKAPHMKLLQFCMQDSYRGIKDKIL